MSTHRHLGRRGFLGIGAAAVATAGLVGGFTSRLVRSKAGAPLGRGTAVFLEPSAYPDAVVTVQLTVRGIRDGLLPRSAELIVETPSGERFTRPLVPPVFEAGKARIDVTLAYPFDERVPGDYRYTVRVDIDSDGTFIETAQAAHYNVRKVVFFS